MALRDYLIRESGEPTCQDCYQHLEWPLHILILLDTAYYVLLLFFSLVVFSFDIAKIHIKLKNNKENMKNYKVFFKLLPFQGVKVASVITQGDCPGLGASALSGRVGASHQLRFLLAERLHNALLSPISFSHRLQPFLYYFHNSLEIKSFFPLNLFQKCFPANYTCCVCRKTFCKQM